MARRLILAVLFGLFCAPGALGQDAAAPIPAPIKTEAKLRVSRELLTYLARDALAALNHANRTGNYAVLRALGTDGFKAEASEEKLAAAFAGFRSQRIDLGQVLSLEPLLTGQPQLEGGDTLHMTGMFPTAPLAVRFDLRMTRTPLGWRIAGLSVATAEAKPASPPGAAKAPAKPLKPAVSRKKAAPPPVPQKPASAGITPPATVDY